MLTTLDKETISIFLKTCKKEIKKGNCHIINRTIIVNNCPITTKQALLNIGILKKEQLWKYILELNIQDCTKVTFDYDKKRDTNSEIFIFQKIINSKNIYIKLTMRKSGIICLSFHESY